MSEFDYKKSFTGYVTKVGPITIFLALGLSLLPLMYLSIRYNALPSGKVMLDAWLGVLSVFGAFYIVEPLSYFAILGVAGTYMSFLSGNIGNMRVPASAVAQEVIGTEPGTQKAELVSTIAIAGSIVTNLIILTFIAVAGQVIISNLPDIAKQSLQFILPSLFGGLIVFYAMKSVRSLFIAPPIALILMLGLHIRTIWIVTLACVFVTMFINVMIYKKQKAAGK